MKTIWGLLVVFLLLGCVSPSVPNPPPVENPLLIPPVNQPPVVGPPAPVTDVNFEVIEQSDGIHIHSDGEKDLVYVPEDACENGVCLLSLSYSLDVNDLTAHVHTTDYNTLNKNTFSLNKTHTFTVAVTQEPVLQTCIFSYAQNDHSYVSSYFATFKHVCLFLDELATETGATVHPNYALIWNSQHATAGEYVGSDIIFLSQENPNQLSTTIMHEITHSLLEDARFPNWINEGLAEYYSSKALDIFHAKTKYAKGLEDWSFGTDLSNPNVSLAFYESAHTTMQNFAEKYGEETLRELTHFFMDHPLASPTTAAVIEKDTQMVLEKMRELTGDQNIVSVEYLANVHMKKK